MTKIIAISRCGKRKEIFDSIAETIRKLHTNEKDVINALRKGSFVTDRKSGASWFLDELFEGK